MKLNTMTKFAMIGLLLLCGATAQAAEKTQADWTTTLNVKLALLNKLGTDSVRIDVDSMNGAVVLSGVVEKRETSELASTIAKSVAGVKSVNNNIEQGPAIANPSKAAAAAGEAEAEVKDVVIETKLRLALIDKMGGDGFKIGTEAASGVVTLEFEPGLSGERRKQAIEVTKGVDGVTKVITVDKK
jgi:osmotically-inducible protein OsmY